MVAAAVIGSAAIGAIGSTISGSQAASAASSGADAQAASNKYAADIQKQIFEEQRSDLAPWRTAGNSALSQMVALDGLAPPTAATTTPGTAASYVITGPNGQTTTLSAAMARQFSQTGSLPAGYSIKPVGGTAATTTPGLTSQQQQQSAMAKFYTDPSYTFTLDQGIQALDRSAASKGRLFSGATGKALEEYGGNLASEQYGNYYNRLAALSGTGQTATDQGNQAAQNYGNSAAALAQNTGQARASAYQATGQAWGNAINGITSSVNNGVGNYLYAQYAGLL